MLLIIQSFRTSLLFIDTKIEKYVTSYWLSKYLAIPSRNSTCFSAHLQEVPQQYKSIVTFSFWGGAGGESVPHPKATHCLLLYLVTVWALLVPAWTPTSYL